MAFFNIMIQIFPYYEDGDQQFSWNYLEIQQIKYGETCVKSNNYIVFIVGCINLYFRYT